jgi:hypothetical protein
LQANVWIAIFSFIGNYFWTHYFYSLLGASYTFPSWRLNDVSRPLPFAAAHITFLTRRSGFRGPDWTSLKKKHISSSLSNSSLSIPSVWARHDCQSFRGLSSLKRGQRLFKEQEIFNVRVNQRGTSGRLFVRSSNHFKHV